MGRLSTLPCSAAGLPHMEIIHGQDRIPPVKPDGGLLFITGLISINRLILLIDSIFLKGKEGGYGGRGNSLTYSFQKKVSPSSPAHPFQMRLPCAPPHFQASKAALDYGLACSLVYDRVFRYVEDMKKSENIPANLPESSQEIAADPDCLEEAFAAAAARARAKANFLRHLAAFLWVGVFLAALNLAASPDSIWFFKPMAVWGAVLAAHGLRAWFFTPRRPAARKGIS
jgi:hypothetical protein